MSEQAGPGDFQRSGDESGGVRAPGIRGGGGPPVTRDRVGRGLDRGGRDRGRDRAEVYFDPARSVSELVDELAQRQARNIRRISAAELAKFYTEIKDLQRLLANGGADAWRQVEPRLRLLRSKAYYANRRIGQGHGIPREFRDFLDRGVQSVRNEEDFGKFARHFEAVVGFLYGMGSVQS